MADEATQKTREAIEEHDLEQKPVELNDEGLVPIPPEAVPLETPLPCSLYIKIGDRYPRIRGQGEKLSVRRMASLTQKGARVLFVHKRVWTKFVGSLEEAATNAEKPEERAMALRTLIVASGTELERKIKEPKKPAFDRLRRLAEYLAVVMSENPAAGLSVLRKDPDPILYFVNHALNTTVYACVIGGKMGYSLADLKMVAYGALVHDVGNLFLSRDLLFKPGALSDDEKALINTHARLGAELLQSVGSPPPVVLATLQHHERMDGRGYPQKLVGDEIHPFARICAVADTYDSLTSNKPYQQGIPPADAIEKMRRFSGQFDPKILNMVPAEPKKKAPAPAPVPAPEEPKVKPT